MSDFIATLLTLSAGGTVLAAVLAAAGRLLGGRLSRGAYYYLYLLVLLRLVLPAASPLRHTAAPARDAVPSAAITASASPEGAASLPEDGHLPAVDAPQSISETAAPGEGTRLNWNGVVTAVWLAGTLGCWCWYAVSYISYSRRILRAAEPAPGDAQAALSRLGGGAELLLSPEAETPMLLGLLKPKIVLPAAVSGERLEHILLHELTHLRRRDLYYKWLAAFVTSVHWFNPFMPLVRREIASACELACDEAVIRRMSVRERQGYGETLIALSAAHRLPAGALSTTLSEGKRLLKGRLLSIMKYRKHGAAAAIIAAALALTLTACAAVLGPAAEPSPAETQSPESPDASPSASPESGTQGEDATVFIMSENSTDGTVLSFKLPIEYAGKLISSGSVGGNMLISIYEKFSYDNAVAAGYGDGGLILSLLRYTEAELEQLLTTDMSGYEVFATDGEFYYVLFTPTDVQFCPADGVNVDTESDEFKEWTELNATLPGLVKQSFIEENGLTPASAAALDEEYTYDSEHMLISYSYDDTTEDDDIIMTLSQPSGQGEGGIWCVERFVDANSNTYLIFPGSGEVTAKEYYDAAQDAADGGEETWRLDPMEVAKEFVANYGYWNGTPTEDENFAVVAYGPWDIR